MATKSKLKRIEIEAERVGIKRAGTEITLPEKPEISLDEAIITLERQREEEETVIKVKCIFDAFPWDGAYAFQLTLNEMFGWTQAVTKQGFFGDTPPKMITIEVSHQQFEEVLWGSFRITGVEGEFGCGGIVQNGIPKFLIHGHCERKYRPLVNKLFDALRETIRTRSIYKGKAFLIETDKDGDIVMHGPPKFMNTNVNAIEDLIFSAAIEEQIAVNLWTLIRHTDACNSDGIPTARRILLEGPYGTGKTLTATATARICEENNWTFIIVDKASGLKAAIGLAQMYGRCVVFCEDIDRSVHGERTMTMDELFNVVSGITSRSQEIIIVLTTNYVERIAQGFLRPGRLDSIITLSPPDPDAAERLMRLYARGRIADGEDLSNAKIAVAGQIPAVIREVVERSKLHAIHRLSGQSMNGYKIIDTDLVHAADGMMKHLQLLNRVEAKKPTTDIERAFTHIVSQAIKQHDPVKNERCIVLARPGNVAE